MPWAVESASVYVAVGDIHGDVQKTIVSLKLAGVLAEDTLGRPVWSGGDAIVVQLGDVLDRGDNEIGQRLSLHAAPHLPPIPGCPISICDSLYLCTSKFFGACID